MAISKTAVLLFTLHDSSQHHARHRLRHANNGLYFIDWLRQTHDEASTDSRPGGYNSPWQKVPASLAAALYMRDDEQKE
jgi:hypothetical protein